MKKIKARSPILVLLIVLNLLVGMVLCSSAWADAAKEAEQMIKGECSTCHKFKGEPESKFNLKGPDLMWAGNKYQRPWLIRWLTGKEENLYPNGYRWDLSQEQKKHPVVTKAQANAIADYFEKNFLDPRVKKSFVDLSTFTEKEAEFGAQIYKDYSCLGCHQIKEDGKLIGGPISVNLYDAGNRYTLDWWSRFAENPQDFTPHSGEYLADITMREARHIIGYVMTLGVNDFKFHEPWKAKSFKKADAKRGSKVYKEYCTQCHGPKGKGDGPGAKGLEPKPAVHAEMALSDFPDDYLYNLLYYGGKSVGKSSMMPDWGMTIPDQGIADVIAYLKATFKGETETKAKPAPESSAKTASKDCIQPRKTKKAPAAFLNRKNPLDGSSANVGAGKKLFMKDAKPIACQMCHGKKGNGKGAAAGGLNPKPRDFTCSPMMDELSDGQLFWIIKNGSKGTGMAAFKTLKDKQVWQLIHYVRSLSK